MHKKLILIGAFAFVFAGVGSSLSSSVQATQPVNGDHKVIICHRNNDVKKPYVQIEVDESAVDGIGGSDHFGKHKGPLASSETVAQQLKDNKEKWGDIIPPVSPYHDGLNWTPEGQAIYNNDCKYVEEPEEPEQPEEPETPVVETPGDVGGGLQELEAPAEAPQAQAPEAGVAAGGAISSVVAYLVALGGSVASMGYGLLRLRNFGA
jgi:hypothetical protein